MYDERRQATAHESRDDADGVHPRRQHEVRLQRQDRLDIDVLEAAHAGNTIEPG
jgi:hypothetical protein